MRAETIRKIANKCGFELAGVASANPSADFDRYQEWVAEGMAGEMRYLTDRRADVRGDVRNLLPSARSVICVGKLYNTPDPPQHPGDAKISRYARGQDYHVVMRAARDWAGSAGTRALLTSRWGRGSSWARSLRLWNCSLGLRPRTDAEAAHA